MANGSRILEELRWRGLLEQVSDEPGLKKLLDEKSRAVYVGFDPTGPSLHLGHLLPLLCLKHFQDCGHKPIVVMGGATGMIGDPSGKSEERVLLGVETIADNIRSQRPQFERFLSFTGENAAQIVNNYDWTAPLSYIEWLREVGKHFSISVMMRKDSVEKRLGGETGISYTEFSYQLLQAFDFRHLLDTCACEIQAGGADQWGNITAGIDFIRKTRGRSAFGVTFPLITTASGEKFGKTSGAAVWLSAEKTSPFEMYQYLVRSDDRDVIRYLKFFTFLGQEEIAALEESLKTAPEKREAQKKLAEEVTLLIHGKAGLEKANRASEILYGGKEIRQLDDAELSAIFSDVPSKSFPMVRLSAGITLGDLLVEAGVAASKGDAKKKLAAGGIYVNNIKADDPARILLPADLASKSLMVLRSGKKNYVLLRFE